MASAAGGVNRRPRHNEAISVHRARAGVGHRAHRHIDTGPDPHPTSAYRPPRAGLLRAAAAASAVPGSRARRCHQAKTAADSARTHTLGAVVNPANQHLGGNKATAVADADRYNYATFWSEEDQEWVGLCDACVAGLSWLDPDRQAAEAGIRAVVEESLEILREHGETPPPPTNPNYLADDPDPSVRRELRHPTAPAGPTQPAHL